MKQTKYRWVIPFAWLILAYAISKLSSNWIYFSVALIFSFGWYCCYFCNRLYKEREAKQ